MAAPDPTRPALSDDDLDDVLALAKDADSVELKPAESFLAAAEVRVFLTKRGVDMGGDQEPKTRRALEFFSKRLRADNHPANGGSSRCSSRCSPS